MAKELGHQRSLALDCRYRCYGYWMGGVRCALAVEQTSAVEADDFGEENTVKGTELGRESVSV